jgi:hypothetical protein
LWTWISKRDRSPVETQPPSAAQSATIPKLRIFDSPQTAGVFRNQRAKAGRIPHHGEVIKSAIKVLGSRSTRFRSGEDVFGVARQGAKVPTFGARTSTLESVPSAAHICRMPQTFMVATVQRHDGFYGNRDALILCLVLIPAAGARQTP